MKAVADSSNGLVTYRVQFRIIYKQWLNSRPAIVGRCENWNNVPFPNKTSKIRKNLCKSH